jgi:hypothetical protein
MTMTTSMSLAEVKRARSDDVSRQSATRFFHGGVLAVPARRLVTGRSWWTSQPSP